MRIPLVIFSMVAMLTGAAAQAESAAMTGVRLDAAALASVRGGFTSPETGLSVSFGIDRAVYVNGDLAASAVMRSTGSTGITLVQRGVGNSFDPATLNSLSTGVVVQNSLDNQKIQTVTTIDVKANSLQSWNGMNLRSSVSNAITASLRR